MPRILIVDDDRALLRLATAWLTGEKNDVMSAASGADARPLLQTENYDLIVMDWDLPDAKGPDIVSEFRAAGGTTPVIMLTGHSSISDKEAGFDAGANDYMVKPFHLKELSARIKAVLRTQAAIPRGPKALGQGNEDVLRATNLNGTELAARYEIIDIVGSGSSAMVLKARHPKSEQVLAVKLLFPGLFRPDQLERFKWEARTIGEVSHQNIARVFDHGLTERDQPYVVSEYIRGEALREKMARDKQLPIATALAILVQACKGLEVAHHKGIVHADIRPENIMLQEGGERPDWVKIVDFGIASLVTPSSLRLTRSGTSIRTAEYTAPERVEGAMAIAGWDTYSLGIMLFEMLTAQVPFQADSVESVMVSAMLENIEPPSRYRDDISPGSKIDELVARATEKTPDMRYQTATELRQDLEKLQNEILTDPRV